MQAASTPSISAISETASSISWLGIAVLQRLAAEPGDRRLLGGGALQLLLGALALGDVVEDAVPDRACQFSSGSSTASSRIQTVRPSRVIIR